MGCLSCGATNAMRVNSGIAYGYLAGYTTSYKFDRFYSFQTLRNTCIAPCAVSSRDILSPSEQLPYHPCPVPRPVLQVCRTTDCQKL